MPELSDRLLELFGMSDGIWLRMQGSATSGCVIHDRRRCKVAQISEGVDLLNLLDKAKNADLYKKLGEWIEKVQSLQMAVDLLT